ncbi:DUF4232 domain-containing protein [Streptomyces hainanensis]|uniref:DUF4232 domain-containing protein n=1 Tax=Streptomyces hainanensis TaxID=402648 RepID=UPI001405430D|nr:DUF4232 domain-containing protein [Streptomyces hainanensis]
MAIRPLRSAAVLTLSVLALAACGESNGTAQDGGSAAEDSQAGERAPDGGEASTLPDTDPGADPEPGEDPGAGADQRDTDPGAGSEADTTDDQGSTRADPAWCSTDALSASLSPLNAAAGQRYAALVLTNTSETACRTQGWPGLTLESGDGAALPTTTVRDDSRAPTQLTLTPGASAWAQLHWTVVASDEDAGDGTCGPDPARLEVIPPDQEAATPADWAFGQVCGAGRIEALPLAEGDGPAE